MADCVQYPRKIEGNGMKKIKKKTKNMDQNFSKIFDKGQGKILENFLKMSIFLKMVFFKYLENGKS